MFLSAFFVAALAGSAQADPKAELDAAYAKLEALDGYRERITFNMDDMSEMDEGGNDENGGAQGAQKQS